LYSKSKTNLRAKEQPNLSNDFFAVVGAAKRFIGRFAARRCITKWFQFPVFVAKQGFSMVQ
jgi:hypothetical protein